MTCALALTIVGAFFDLLGIALVGAADYVPQVRRGAARFARFLARLRRWLAVTVLRRRRGVTHHVSPSDAIAVGGRARRTTSPGTETLEGKVDYLLREADRTQRRLDDLEGASADERARVSAELDAVREEFKEHVAQALDDAAVEYIHARRLGLACLGISLVLFVLAAIVA